MNTVRTALIIVFFVMTCANAHGDDETNVELETTVIKGNKEAPQVLYMIPWRENKKAIKRERQKLVLHSLFGDLFDPVLPDYFPTPNNPKE